jgi:glycosyltransferase involved in cell wall biosynthesis
MDQYGMMNNGTTSTARQLAYKLRSRGHTVRVVTCVPDLGEENLYVTGQRYYPFISKLMLSHGMVLAKPDDKILEDAIRGSDIVHFFLQFKLAQAGKKVADRLGIASTAAFHVQPENVTYNIGVNKFDFVNEWLYGHWRKFFNKFKHVHVPSSMMRSLLLQHGYKSEIHAVSNGVNDDFVKLPANRPEELKDKFLILMIGRYSREKRQDVLIRAIAKSKYADKIQLVLCGRGPCEKKLRALARKILPVQPIFKFCDKPSLIETINYCDLYVHASEIESEAIACMEAFMCGLVPVISDAVMSAAKQFALRGQNLFKNGDPGDLAQKIDYYIENPDKKAAAQAEYLKFAENFRLDHCVDEMEKIFAAAIAENVRRKENTEAEQQFLSEKSLAEVKKYYKKKLAYQEEAEREGEPDYWNEYINVETNAGRAIP